MEAVDSTPLILPGLKLDAVIASTLSSSTFRFAIFTFDKTGFGRSRFEDVQETGAATLRTRRGG